MLHHKNIRKLDLRPWSCGWGHGDWNIYAGCIYGINLRVQGHIFLELLDSQDLQKTWPLTITDIRRCTYGVNLKILRSRFSHVYKVCVHAAHPPTHRVGWRQHPNRTLVEGKESVSCPLKRWKRDCVFVYVCAWEWISSNPHKPTHIHTNPHKPTHTHTSVSVVDHFDMMKVSSVRWAGENKTTLKL